MTRLILLAVAFAATVLALVLFDRIEETPVQVITERHEAADVTIPIRHPETPPPTMPPGIATTTTTTVVEAKARTAPTRPPATDATITELEQIIRDGFTRFGPAVAEEAVNVAWCETGGTLNPNSTGAEGERGLLQIHGRWHMDRIHRLGFTWDQMYDPAANVAVAADLYADSAWQPWTCRYAA